MDSLAEDYYALRLAAMVEELGDPIEIFKDEDNASPRIDICVFERDFTFDCDDEAESDDGYVLITNGMSEWAMPVPPSARDNESSRCELIWYVKTIDPEIIANLRWLARFPRIDHTWLGLGHTIPMPKAPLSMCLFKNFFFMPPIYGPDEGMLQTVEIDDQPVATLTVNLVSDSEYTLIRSPDGLDQFFDLLDEHDYPMCFNPGRISYT